jgi:hypothetical protein
MTPEARRKRPEHHVVHDYTNLVSSWRLREPHHVAELMRIPTANGHAWHAFQMNCRKMFEFFKYKPDGRNAYLRAAHFIDGELGYTFVHWNDKVQEFMNAHLLHVGMDRMDNEIINDGRNDKQYFADFEGAWQGRPRRVPNRSNGCRRPSNCGTPSPRFLSCSLDSTVRRFLPR